MAGAGIATVNMSFESWDAPHIAPSRHEATVITPKPGPKLEPVSKQLQRELIHPNRNSLLGGLAFSPDGTRLIAGDDPGGIVMVWEVASGKQLVKVETGYGRRGGSKYFFVSPDWKTVYVSRGKAKYEKIEKDGKQMYRWEFDGSVRAWNLATGQLERTYKHDPPRNVRGMSLSPDGKTFVAYEELPGVFEGRGQRAASFWEVATGKPRPLPEGFDYGKFSPDGRTYAALASYRGTRSGHALVLIDVASAKVKWSVPAAEKTGHIYPTCFSPNGRLLVGEHLVYEKINEYRRWQGSLKIWDADTGREVTSFPTHQDDYLSEVVFSPDGATLVAENWLGETKKLLFLRPEEKRPPREIMLGKRVKGQQIVSIAPVFSPDGKWLAQITQIVPEVHGDDLDARDAPQARIHLIDMETAKIRETLIAPQGFVQSACFSPDGKTLATGGHGRVLLWDVSKLAAK